MAASAGCGAPKSPLPCSLNGPLEWRLKQIGEADLRRAIKDFGLNLADAATPPERALAVGHLAASPRTVHQMAGTVLGALTARTHVSLAPSLLRRSEPETTQAAARRRLDEVIRPAGRPLLAQLLAAPICYRYGTLRKLGDWCAARRDDIALHFAKTGTRGTGARARNAYDTVDLWVAGGIQFANGPAYSYVVLIGTGSPAQPWARDLYAGTTAEPLVRALLDDLSRESAAAAPASSIPVPAPQPPARERQAKLAPNQPPTAQRGRP